MCDVVSRSSLNRSVSSHASFLFVSISSRDLTREIQKEGAFCAFSASSDDDPIIIRFEY